MKYIDMHCDTLSVGLAQYKETITTLDGTMVDVKRLLEADAGAQFLPCLYHSVMCRNGMEEMPEHEVLWEKMHDIFVKTLRENADKMAFA